MNKGTHFSGQPMYGQLIDLLDKDEILKFSRAHHGVLKIIWWYQTWVKPRVESITDDNMESNSSMTRKYSSKRSEFLRFNLYLSHVISEFCLFIFATLR